MYVKIIYRTNSLWNILYSIDPEFKTSAYTIAPVIFMPEWCKVNPEGVREKALLIHEETHVQQSNNMGFLGLPLFWIYWLFFTSKRKELEMAAYKEQLKYIYSKEGNIDANSWADMITTIYAPFTFIGKNECVGMINGWIEEFKKEVVK